MTSTHCPSIALMATKPHPTAPDAAVPLPSSRTRGDGVRALTYAISRGDDRAFERFYNTWFEPAYAMARALTRRDESFCLDVVQDAMLKAARSMKPLDTDDQLAAWVKRVVHTAALDRLRAERRRLARERNAAPDDLSTHRLARTDERIAWLRAQIDTLPSEDRSLLLFRFARARTIEATAHAHALTPGAAHGRIRRALRRLRDAGKDQTP